MRLTIFLNESRPIAVSNDTLPSSHQNWKLQFKHYPTKTSMMRKLSLPNTLLAYVKNVKNLRECQDNAERAVMFLNKYLCFGYVYKCMISR